MPGPRVGDSVWAPVHFNGVIRHIDWSYDKEVTVFFHNSGEEETFEWRDFYSFNERLNQWQLR